VLGGGCGRGRFGFGGMVGGVGERVGLVCEAGGGVGGRGRRG